MMVYFYTTEDDGCLGKLKQKPLPSLKFIFSPDLYFANFFKKMMLENELNKSSNSSCLKTKSHTCFTDKDGICVLVWDSIKIKRKYYLILSNWTNLIVSIIFVILGLILNELFNAGHFIWDLLVFIYIYRVISRTVEICFAFYSDVVRKNDKVFTSGIKNNGSDDGKSETEQRIIKYNEHYIHNWKNSYLLKGDRLSLAFHSLLEITLLYSFIYFIFHNTAYNDLVTTWGSALFYSISVSAMNISYSDNLLNIFFVASVMQLITVLTLIVLSIASYIGDKDELTKREEGLYLYYSRKNNIKGEDKSSNL